MFYGNSLKWVEAEDTRSEIARCISLADNDSALSQSLERLQLMDAIEAAHIRHLSFYRSYSKLVRFTLSPDHVTTEEPLDTAFLFVIISETDAQLLNGTSPVIHKINATKVQIGTNGTATEVPEIFLESREQFESYLDFFCSFVTGDDGPFTTIEQLEDVEFGLVGRVEPIATYDTLVTRRRENLGWPKPSIPVREEDLEQLKSNREAVETKYREEAEKDERRRENEDSPEYIKSEIANFQGDYRRDEASKESGDNSAFIKKLVWYGPALFEADFRVLTSGMVEMLDDNPTMFLSYVPWRFDNKTGIASRKSGNRYSHVSVDSFRERVFENDKVTVAPTESRKLDPISRQIVTGDVDLSGVRLTNELRLDDVIIDGDLILEAATLDKGLNFNNTRITGRLICDNIVTHAFIATKLSIAGLFSARLQLRLPSETYVKNGFSMQNGEIASHFTLDEVTIGGGADLRRLVCRGPARITKLDIHTRLPTLQIVKNFFPNLPKPPGQNTVPNDEALRLDSGVNLAHARFFDLLDWVTPESGDNSVAGGISANHFQVTKSLRLRRLKTTDAIFSFLTFEDSQINELIEANSTASPNSKKSKRNQFVFDAEAKEIKLASNYGQSGFVELKESHIEGELDASAMACSGFLTLYNTVIDGNLDISQTAMNGDLYLTGTTVKRSVIGTELRCKTLFAGAMNVGRDCSFDGAFVDGTFNMQGAEVKGMLSGNCTTTQRTRISGNLVASGMIAHSDFRFVGALIKGNLEIITGSFNRFQLRATLIQSPPDTEPDKQGGTSSKPIFTPFEVGGSIIFQSFKAQSIDLYAARIGEDCKFSALELTDSISFFNSNPIEYLAYGEQPFSDDDIAACIPDWSERMATINGKFNLDSVSIGSDLALQNTHIEDSLETSRLIIRGDVLAGSRPEKGPNANFDGLITRCKSANFDSVTVDGSMKLDGLKLWGDFSCRYAKVEKEVVFFDPASNRCLDFEDNTIPSTRKEAGKSMSDHPDAPKMDMTGITTEVVRLRVSREDCPTVLLESADVKVLDFNEDFGGRLDLRNARISDWKIRRKNEAAEDAYDKASPLIRVLKGEQFDGAVYTAAENWLRKQGDSIGADRLHRSSRRSQGKARRTNIKDNASLFWPITWVWDGLTNGFLWLTTGYWTRSGQLLIAMVLPMMIMTCLLANQRSNIAPSPVQLGEEMIEQDAQAPADWRERVTSRTDMPPEELWSLVHVSQLLAVNHVPIVALVSQPRWEFRDDRNAELKIPFTNQMSRLPFKPASWALASRIVAWIAWPLFLLGIVANIQRRHPNSNA